MGSFIQASWQDHAMLQLSSGPRQHVAALLPKTNSAWVPNSVLGVSSDNPERRGDKRSRNLPYFFKVFFFPFLLCVFYSLRPGHAIVQNLLFEADAEKTKFRNIWKKHEQNESEKQSQALPFCFLL